VVWGVEGSVNIVDGANADKDGVGLGVVGDGALDELVSVLAEKVERDASAPVEGPVGDEPGTALVGERGEGFVELGFDGIAGDEDEFECVAELPESEGSERVAFGEETDVLDEAVLAGGFEGLEGPVYLILFEGAAETKEKDIEGGSGEAAEGFDEVGAEEVAGVVAAGGVGDFEAATGDKGGTAAGEEAAPESEATADVEGDVLGEGVFEEGFVVGFASGFGGSEGEPDAGEGAIGSAEDVAHGVSLTRGTR